MSFAPHRSGKRGEAVKSLRPPTPILGALEYRVANKIRDHMKAVHFRQTDIFHRFDRDGSGKLDARELRSALAEIGLKLTLTEIKAFGASLDLSPLFGGELLIVTVPFLIGARVPWMCTRHSGCC
eukprot:SAG31_NODE_1770_length_7309_cov_56.975867_7_plen_125_part_00